MAVRLTPLQIRVTRAVRVWPPNFSFDGLIVIAHLLPVPTWVMVRIVLPSSTKVTDLMLLGAPWTTAWKAFRVQPTAPLRATWPAVQEGATACCGTLATTELETGGVGGPLGGVPVTVTTLVNAGASPAAIRCEQL